MKTLIKKKYMYPNSQRSTIYNSEDTETAQVLIKDDWLKKVCAYVCCHFSRVCLIATPRTLACQAPLSMGILQTSILEWVAMPCSRGSPQPRDGTQGSGIAGRCVTVWVTGKLVYICMLAYMCIDRDAWLAAVYGVTKSGTWLRDWTELNQPNGYQRGKGWA